MDEPSVILRSRFLIGLCALILLVVLGVFASSAPHAAAAISLLYFRATPSGDSILLEWETATEQDTVAFNLYRSQDSGSQGQQIGETFPAQGDSITGALYSYRDIDVVPGVRYYYSLAEIDLSGGLTIIARANAGIGMLTPTPTVTRTPTVTPAPAVTRTPTVLGPVRWIYLPMVVR